MKTLRLLVDPERITEREEGIVLGQAAGILRAGRLVALPTETVYGLGANALDAVAVARIFEAKERPGWDPLIVHVSDEAMLAGLVTEIPATARLLMEAFWPGPLTLLLPRSGLVPDAVTAGRLLVGVRMPAHPVALEIIRLAGVPIAAPSANRFGRISPTTAAHVLEDLDGRIDAVVDSGPTGYGVESTVVDPCATPMIVYRPGAISVEQIIAVAGPAELFVETAGMATEPRSAMPSPGVGVRHYSPRARLVLVEEENIADKADLAPRLYLEAVMFLGERVGVMLPSGLPGEPCVAESIANLESFAEIFPWGCWPESGKDPEELARRLFAGLRWLDSQGCTVIVCPVPPEHGIGRAIRDRLYKAAFKANPE